MTCWTSILIGRLLTRCRKHLAGDIVPYTCILPECAAPDALFPTKDLWHRHLLEEHHNLEYWTCSICRNGFEAPDEESFVAHINTHHAEHISQDRIPILAGLSRRLFPAEINCCMFCGWSQAEGAEMNKDDLIEHIAQEVHSFSLRSLPWPDEPEELVVNWGGSSENAINPLLEREPPRKPFSISLVQSSGKPLAEPVVAHTSYSQRNPHLAEGSSSIPSSEYRPAAVRDHSIADHQKTSEGSLSIKSNLSRHSTSSVTNQHLSDEDWTDLTDDQHNDKVRRHWRRRCNARGCHRKPVYSTIRYAKVTSLYCQEHTCQVPCDALRGFCPIPRDPTNKFCPNHGKCSRSGCILLAPRQGVSCHDFPWTCPRRKSF